jgi:2-isopropylmalate synthase
MKPEVELYDTTLRDGSQGEGINFSVMDKLRIAEKLDAFGIHYVEGGWPGSNPKDMAFFAEAKRRKFKQAKLAAFSMTRRKGVAVEKDELMRMLLEAETPVVTIVGKTWLLHVTEVLRAKPDENLAMIADTVGFFKEHGKTVFYDAEHSFDGWKSEPEYALATWQAAEKAGADAIVLCDTNGGSLPCEVSRITTLAKSKLAKPIGIHTHNDCGFGLANAIAAVEAGAMHVQGTINGYGERTGNCNLVSVIPTLALKMGRQCVPKDSLPKLRDLSHFVDEIANLKPDSRQPWVGAAAFAHKGGMHAHAVERVANSYEHIKPESVGNLRRVLVSDMSGRSNILAKARELNIPLSTESPELKTILAKVKELESRGFEFEAAEGSLALLIRKVLSPSVSHVKVQSYLVSMNGGLGTRFPMCQASVDVVVDSKTGMEATATSFGDGPVNALDNALRDALVRIYPQLKKVKLVDYKVRVLGGADGTAAKTRVLIESTDGKREWGTVGVSENIIEASLAALVDSMEYALLRE